MWLDTKKIIRNKKLVAFAGATRLLDSLYKPTGAGGVRGKFLELAVAVDGTPVLPVSGNFPRRWSFRGFNDALLNFRVPNHSSEYPDQHGPCHCWLGIMEDVVLSQDPAREG